MNREIASLRIPAAVQRIRWVVDPVGYLQDCFEGDQRIVRARFSPAFRGEVFLTDHPHIIAACESGRAVSAPGELNAVVAQIVGPHSLLLQSGQEHRRRRKLLLPPFHGERLRGYGQDITSITIEAMDEIEDETAFSARDVMQSISLRVILKVVFGLRRGIYYRQLEALLDERPELRAGFLGAMTLFSPLLRRDLGTWSPGGKITRNDARTRSLLADLIVARRQELIDESQNEDILSLLITSRDENGTGLADEEIQDELLTLLFAGHETTATALGWALYWIHSLPAVLGRLQAEVDALDDTPDLHGIDQLPYLDAVCRETLRIHPVAMLQFPRRVEQPLKVLDYQLMPGDILMGCILGVHRRPDIYPEPLRYRPERFLEREFSPTEFMPFGGGARRCIGDALALFEMKRVIASILRRWHLVKLDRRPVGPRRRGITLAPSRPVKLWKQRR